MSVRTAAVGVSLSVRTAAVGVAALAATAALGGTGTCPVALLTGAACPGCGMTRAVVALLRGDVSASWRWHPLAAAAVAYAAVTCVHWLRDRAGYAAGRYAGRHAILLAALAGALIVVWMARLASGTLPPV